MISTKGVLKAAEEEGDLGRRVRAFLDLLCELRTRKRRGDLGGSDLDHLPANGLLRVRRGPSRGRAAPGQPPHPPPAGREFDRFARPGLFRFLRFLKTLQDSEGDLGTAPIQGPGDDVVRLMSIHKSKGLEFPVVFLGDLGKGFNFKDAEGDLLFQRDLGVGPKVVDLERGIKYPSLAHRAVRQALIREALAEEMRILYVALTRAKEKLILVGTTDLAKKAGLAGRAVQSQGWAPSRRHISRGCKLPRLAHPCPGPPPGTGSPFGGPYPSAMMRWRRTHPAGRSSSTPCIISPRGDRCFGGPQGHRRLD